MSNLFSLKATPMTPSEMIRILSMNNPLFDDYLAGEIYANHDKSYIERQKARMIETLKLHEGRVGNAPTYLLRAPGRLNAFLEYLDMCAGDHMSTTIDGDIPVAVSVRGDDVVSLVNSNPLFQAGNFGINEEFDLFMSAPWDFDDLADTWDNRTRVYPYYGHTQGEWLNYVRSPFIRVKWEYRDIGMKGVNMTFGPSTAPFRAGTSSSSAIVVLSFLALYLANRDVLPQWDMVDVCQMLGQAEWYVGTHGGANDQTTILRNLPNGVLYNRYSRPIPDSDLLQCVQGVRVVLADSLWEANKALGANHIFNLRKGWMDLGDDIMQLILKTVKRYLSSSACESKSDADWLVTLVESATHFPPGIYPSLLTSKVDFWSNIFVHYHKFGSLCSDILGVPDEAIEELIYLLPNEISVEEAGNLLNKTRSEMQRDYTLPYQSEGGYRVRSAAIFFHKENKIGRRLEKIFRQADEQISIGEIDIRSSEYDQYRVEVGKLLEQLQNTIRNDFQVSNDQLELLLSIAKGGPGYLGGKLTGAGSGGCVSIMIREGHEEEFCQYLDDQYYNVPENFDEYRKVLDSLADHDEGSLERQIAAEMKQNLLDALADHKKSRRAVTFSRGACALSFQDFISKGDRILP